MSDLIVPNIICFHTQLEVGDDLGICVLNLQVVSEISKSLIRPRDKRDM